MKLVELLDCGGGARLLSGEAKHEGTKDHEDDWTWGLLELKPLQQITKKEEAA